MRAALIACVLPLFAAAEAAAQDGTCGRFFSSLGQQIDLFADYLPIVESAQSLPKEGVFSLVLKPVGDVIYAAAPERGSNRGHGGIVTIEGVPAGRYRIGLSEEAWVDVVQNNARLSVLGDGREHECLGVRRSVTVDAEGLPLTLQIGGAKVGRLNIAVIRVWPFTSRW